MPNPWLRVADYLEGSEAHERETIGVVWNEAGVVHAFGSRGANGAQASIDRLVIFMLIAALAGIVLLIQAPGSVGNALLHAGLALGLLLLAHTCSDRHRRPLPHAGHTHDRVACSSSFVISTVGMAVESGKQVISPAPIRISTQLLWGIGWFLQCFPKPTYCPRYLMSQTVSFFRLIWLAGEVWMSGNNPYSEAFNFFYFEHFGSKHAS